jgi:hypothetical protein
MAVQEDAVLAQKIAEMQKQFKVANISAAREKRYGVTVDDGPRIVINQCSCDIQTKHFGYRGVGCRQNWNPILVVMRIARQDVHGAMLEQPLRAAAGCLSPESSHGGGGHLHKTAFFGPFQHPPEILLQDRISLRVSQNGSKAAGKQTREKLVDLERYGVVTELYEQVFAIPDRVPFRVGQNSFEIIVRKMEVASQAKSDRSCRATL